MPNTETRLTVGFHFPKHSMGPSWKAWHVYCFSFFHSKANLSNDYTQPCVTQQLHWVLHKVRTFPSSSLCQFAPKCQPSVNLLPPEGKAPRGNCSAVNSHANNFSAPALPSLSSHVILWSCISPSGSLAGFLLLTARQRALIFSYAFKELLLNIFWPTSLWFIFHLPKLMLFPILIIWIQLLPQKEDLFLGALFIILLFKPVLVHFVDFLQSLISPLFTDFNHQNWTQYSRNLGLWGLGGELGF